MRCSICRKEIIGTAFWLDGKPICGDCCYRYSPKNRKSKSRDNPYITGEDIPDDYSKKYDTHEEPLEKLSYSEERNESES